MEQAEFHDQVIKALAELQAQNEEIIRRLDKQNGSITKLFSDTADIKIELARHPTDCPIRAKVDTLDRELQTGQHPGSVEMRRRIEALERASVTVVATETTSRKWLTELKPILWAIGGAIILMLFLHADAVLKYLSR